MLNALLDPGSYMFWLALISVCCFLAERVRPWRAQRAFRDQFPQDIFWLVFNGHYAAVLLAPLSALAVSSLRDVFVSLGIQPPDTVRLVSDLPLGVQFVVFIVVKDFAEWCVHNLLHRVPLLWEFHKVHHSIEQLDWIGSFRFHWVEIVLYGALTYVPLAVCGVDSRVMLAIAVFSTLIGHLNHANLKLDWGVLRYLFNSPRMHVWHHDVVPAGGHGKNFGVIFSAWDWLFGTAYLPADREQPERLGFVGMEDFPRSLVLRLLQPLVPVLRWTGRRFHVGGVTPHG